VATATGESFADLQRQFGAELFLQPVGIRPRGSAADDGLAELDLADAVGPYGLVGPRFALWNPDERLTTPEPFAVAGTAMRHVIVAAGKASRYRITIDADAGAELDVALVRMPRTLARLKLELVPHYEGGWQIVVREQTGQAVRIRQLVWEACNTGTDSRQRRFDAERLSRVFDDVWVPAGGELVSRPVRFSGAESGPVLVRVGGVDEAGHHVAAWAELDPSASSGQLAWLD
jgi:hypothetical protein